MRAWKTWIGLTSLLTVAAAGCVIEVSFDPLGSDFTANASWTLNGLAPTADLCAQAGVTDVAYAFRDGSVEYKYSTTRFRCAAGQGQFGLRYPASEGYKDGYIIVAIFENNGIEVGRGELPALNVVAPTTSANLAVVNLSFQPPTGSVNINLQWESAVSSGTHGDCNLAKVMNYDYSVADATSAVVASGDAVACNDAALRLEDFTPGNYMINVTGHSTGTAGEWSGPPCIVTIQAGLDSTATCLIQKLN